MFINFLSLIFLNNNKNTGIRVICIIKYKFKNLKSILKMERKKKLNNFKLSLKIENLHE